MEAQSVEVTRIGMGSLGADGIEDHSNDDGVEGEPMDEHHEDKVVEGTMPSARNRDLRLLVAAGHTFAMQTSLFLQSGGERARAMSAANKVDSGGTHVAYA